MLSCTEGMLANLKIPLENFCINSGFRKGMIMIYDISDKNVK